MAQGYNPDIDLVDRDGSPDFTKQPATAAFFGLNLLTHPKTTSEIKSRILNNEGLYSELSTGIYNEISELVESQNTNNQEKGDFFLRRILSEPEVLSSLENIPVNLNEEPQLRDPLIAAYGDVYQNAESATMSELFRSLAPELVSESPNNIPDPIPQPSLASNAAAPDPRDYTPRNTESAGLRASRETGELIGSIPERLEQASVKAEVRQAKANLSIAISNIRNSGGSQEDIDRFIEDTNEYRRSQGLAELPK